MSHCKSTALLMLFLEYKGFIKVIKATDIMRDHIRSKSLSETSRKIGLKWPHNVLKWHTIYEVVIGPNSIVLLRYSHILGQCLHHCL